MPPLKEDPRGSTIRLTLRQVRDYQFEVAHAGWKVTLDVPPEMGGHVPAPCPTELFLISLAACQLITGLDWAARHGKDLQGLELDLAAESATDAPRRIKKLRLAYRGRRAQAGEELTTTFLRASRACKIANTLKRPPEVEVVAE